MYFFADINQDELILQQQRRIEKEVVFLKKCQVEIFLK